MEMDEPLETEAPAVVNLIASPVPRVLFGNTLAINKTAMESSSKMMEFSATFAIALCQLRVGILTHS